MFTSVAACIAAFGAAIVVICLWSLMGVGVAMGVALLFGVQPILR